MRTRSTPCKRGLRGRLRLHPRAGLPAVPPGKVDLIEGCALTSDVFFDDVQLNWMYKYAKTIVWPLTICRKSNLQCNLCCRIPHVHRARSRHAPGWTSGGTLGLAAEPRDRACPRGRVEGLRHRDAARGDGPVPLARPHEAVVQLGRACHGVAGGV